MRYENRSEAIDQAIIAALGGQEDDFDVDAIFDETFRYHVDRNEDGLGLANSAGFEQVVTVEEFWKIVEKHAR
jgi:hypothetical protein